MASTITVAPSQPSNPTNHLTMESIPTVDLRLLTQSDLTALSLSSSHAFDLRRCDDVVIPKIDRSIFNESAGSRKQTYSRLRLAPRNKPPLPNSPLTPHPPALDTERTENARIISLFKHLFRNSTAAGCCGDTVTDEFGLNIENDDLDYNSRGSIVVDETELELDLVPVNVTYSDTVPVPISHGYPVSVTDGTRKRKRGRKPKSAGNISSSDALPVQSLALAVVEESVEGQVEVEVKRDEEEGVEEREEREKELANRDGVEVDLWELAKLEDPYGEELRRRTEGKTDGEELLGFIGELEGQWGSRRKKRKIVDANLFGDFLPNGWKVLIAMKKKLGRAWVFVRRYVSPNGRYFASCKEVSSYLLSLTGAQELKQQTTVQCPDNSVVDNNVASENAADIVTNLDPPSSEVASEFNDHENRQLQLYTPQTSDHEKQLVLSENVNLGEEQAISTLKCHKCCSLFREKDELLSHLISCHKRKRRKSGTLIEDDVIMKDGKYECQFCNKVFLERNSYFGHVGIHVKNYVKSIGGTPGVTAKQRTSDPVATGEVHAIVSETLGAAKLNAAFGTEAPSNIEKSELNGNIVDSRMKASSDAETHITGGNNVQNNLSLHVELNVEGGQTEKTAADESFGKQDGSDPTTGNNVMEVDEAADSAVKPVNSSNSDKVYSNENDDLCDNSRQINVTECLGSEISKSPAVLVGNAEACLFPDVQQEALEDDGNFVKANIVQRERVASENCLFAESEENTLSNSDSADGSLNDEAVEHNSYDIGVKLGENDGLMVRSASGHLDPCTDTEGDVQNSGALEGCSAVHLFEEDRSGITATSATPAGDQHTFEMQNCAGQDFTGVVNESTHSGSGMILVSRDNGSGYIGNEAETVSDVEMVEPMGAGAFQVEQSCSPENSIDDISDREVEEPRNDQVVNTSNLFFTSGNCDTDLNANCMADDGQADDDVSNVLGAFSSFVEDKQEQVPKNIFSGLSMNENDRDAINDVMNVSSTTTSMQLPELDKAESSRSNKLILDFGNMTEMNARYMSSVQHESVPEEASPFSLWGQQTCGLEDNQTRVYGGARELAQQERSSDNNSLNLVGLQQPSDVGYNLNKVCMNEQRYVQHNESGGYNSRNEARSEGISHGNTLNLAGFQQQCDAGYNLNKPCINQQSYGVQHNEARVYNTPDEARQERVAYGNSLSLASVQQTCDTRYSLNKSCAQQTCDTGYSLNKGFMETLQGFSKLDDLGHSRDRDLMIGFGNSGGRPNQPAATDFLWRSSEGNALSGGLVDSSSSQGQTSGSFQAFDFLSDKGGSDLYTANDKFGNMSSFEGLRSSVEPMEFSFMTAQESNPQLEHQKVLSYNTQINPGFGSTVWNQKGTSLPNMMPGHVVTTMCVWCGNEFHQDSLNCEMQSGSIGYLCPTCKARMSGQFL